MSPATKPRSRSVRTSQPPFSRDEEAESAANGCTRFLAGHGPRRSQDLLGTIPNDTPVDYYGVGGVVHTHSRYATAWAARGEPIPCVLTAMADEFGSALLIPPQSLATDNAAMIGIAGWQKLTAHGPSNMRFGPQPDLRLVFS